MKAGDKIRIIRMDDNNGNDIAVHRMNGVIGVISYIADMGQIHLERYGLSVMPEVDEFDVIQ